MVINLFRIHLYRRHLKILLWNKTCMLKISGGFKPNLFFCLFVSFSFLTTILQEIVYCAWQKCIQFWTCKGSTSTCNSVTARPKLVLSFLKKHSWFFNKNLLVISTLARAYILGCQNKNKNQVASVDLEKPKTKTPKPNQVYTFSSAF